jgi:hypothetical protein
MIRFQDFLPRATGSGGFLGLGTSYETIEQTLAAANAWIAKYNLTVLNVETLVLPNIDQEKTGTVSARLWSSGDMRTDWYQAIRVWYDVPS